MVNAKRIVEQISNIAIILVCGVLCWTYLTRKTLKFAGGQSDSNGEQLVGFTLPAFTGYTWQSHPETLVLVLRVGCHYCQDSMPFYRKLNDLEKSNHLRAHLLVVMPDSKQGEDKDLESNGLSIDGVFNQSLGPMRVTGTPTLLLADPRGRIEQAWVGELSAQSELEVIAKAEK